MEHMDNSDFHMFSLNTWRAFPLSHSQPQKLQQSIRVGVGRGTSGHRWPCAKGITCPKLPWKEAFLWLLPPPSQEKCTASLDMMLVLGDGALIPPQLSFGVITACLLCSSSVNENNSTSVKMSCWSLEDGDTKPSQAPSY